MSLKRVHLALALRELRPAPDADACKDVDASEFSGWAVWRGSEIPLWNFLPTAWESRVLELVDAFNYLRPSPMPPLVQRSLEDLRCEAIPTRLLARRGITTCLADALHDPDVVASVDPQVARNHIMQRAVIRISSDRIPGADSLCHELTHALTGIDDIQYDQEHRFPYEDDSCIWGFLDVPGAFDRQLIRWVYRKDARRRGNERPVASNARRNDTGRR